MSSLLIVMLSDNEKDQWLGVLWRTEGRSLVEILSTALCFCMGLRIRFCKHGYFFKVTLEY